MTTSGNQASKRFERPAIDEQSSCSPAFIAFFKAIERIEEIVTQEITCLRLSLTPDLGEFNDQKARALLQFSRTLRALDVMEERARLKPMLDGLQARLEENCKLLQFHVDAARDVATIVSRAMLEADSDGTYGRDVPAFRRGT